MTEPNKGGRPSFQPSEKERAQCKTLAAMGVPHSDIAIVLHISEPTLRKYFRHELDAGSIEANAKVASALFRAATDDKRPSVVAQIFWLKTRAGWTEPGSERDPRAPREEPPGKKEIASRAARTAQAGTDWADLLPGPATPQ